MVTRSALAIEPPGANSLHCRETAVSAMLHPQMPQLDHIVLWVEDPLRSVEFYTRVVGLAAERVVEFRENTAPFPSVRLDEHTLFDLMPLAMAPRLNALPGAAGSAGNRMRDSFGARGQAPEAFYFGDPDGNVLEARWYA